MLSPARVHARHDACRRAVRARSLPARERELASHHQERQAKRQARRQEPYHFGRRQGVLPPKNACLAAAAKHALLSLWCTLPRQLRLAMLTWYCAEGSGHVEDRPCQNFHFMQRSSVKAGAPTLDDGGGPTPTAQPVKAQGAPLTGTPPWSSGGAAPPSESAVKSRAEGAPLAIARPTLTLTAYLLAAYRQKLRKAEDAETRKKLVQERSATMPKDDAGRSSTVRR